MSSLQGIASGGSGNDGAPGAKRQRLNDQEDAPDPSKIKIEIEGRAEVFIVDRQTAVRNSLFIKAAMSGPWANAQTGTIVLARSDFATPRTVGFLKEYLDYLEEIANGGNGDGDPLDDIDEFGPLANFWMLADYLGSEKIANAIMAEFQLKAGEIEELDEDTFMEWWEVLEDQPSFDALRGVMVALFVVSGDFENKGTRDAMMRALPADAREAVVDELIRQHDNTQRNFKLGARRLDEVVDDDGYEVLNELRHEITTKVVATDFHKAYTRPGE